MCVGLKGDADVNLYPCQLIQNGMLVGTRTYSFQWNRPWGTRKNCQNLNQHHSKGTSTVCFSKSCHCFIQPITSDCCSFFSISSPASDTLIYVENYYGLAAWDENLFGGLHIRSVGCSTCHALTMRWDTIHDVHSVWPSHLSCHSPL